MAKYVNMWNCESRNMHIPYANGLKSKILASTSPTCRLSLTYLTALQWDAMTDIAMARECGGSRVVVYCWIGCCTLRGVETSKIYRKYW
jgi:hypothetical protein